MGRLGILDSEKRDPPTAPSTLAARMKLTSR
jgi:hypothetical protein